MNASVKNLVFWVVMMVTAILIWASVKSSTGQMAPRNLTFTDFSHEIAQDNVREVTITAPASSRIYSVQGVFRKDGMPFKTAAPVDYTDWLAALMEKNAKVTFDPAEGNSWMT